MDTQVDLAYAEQAEQALCNDNWMRACEKHIP